MIRKTVLLTGIAGLMLTASAAFAQDAATAPAPAQTDPAQAAPAAAPAQTPAAQPGTLQLQPGSDVKGSDGAVLGKLEGVRTNAAGEQELTVRGTDGQLRGVPLAGLKPEGAGVTVGWTTAEYTAAPAIAGAAPAATPAPEAAAPDAAAPDSTSTEPMAEPSTTDAPKTDATTTDAPATDAAPATAESPAQPQ